MLSAWRLQVAAAAMSAPSARTEDVAAALGYGSPQAFCVAMHRAGLPAPGAVRRCVRALG